MNEGDLIPVDVGVEADSLYTADITRILPVNGHFTEAQIRVYRAILDACEAALARTNEPGTCFRDVHGAIMFVIAIYLREWGLLPVSVEEPLSPVGQQYRRWMPYSTGHRLGLDIHDRAQAHHEMYQDALLEFGVTFTTEPGLYFRTDDEAIPAEYRDIGVCIEDDIVVSEDGSVTQISKDISHTIDGVEVWIAEAQER